MKICEGKYLRLVSKDGWEFAQRCGSRGVVTILAITDRDEIVLVEQNRIPVGRVVIELPAGLRGDIGGQEDEPLEEAARRELLEETGYEASELLLLSEGPSSAGLSDEVITMFLARGLKKTGDGGGDESEQIIVHEVALDDAEDFLAGKQSDGALVDPKVYAGLYFATRK